MYHAINLLSNCYSYVIQHLGEYIFLNRFVTPPGPETNFALLSICRLQRSITIPPKLITTILNALRLLWRAVRGQQDTHLKMPGLTSGTNSQKLSGYRFYEEVLGSPKFVVAPMVDQSELVSKVVFRPGSMMFITSIGLEDFVPSIRSTSEQSYIADELSMTD